MLQHYEFFDIRFRYLLILLLGLPYLTLIFFIFKTNKNLFKLTTFFNILGMVLIIIPLTNIFYHSTSFPERNNTYGNDLFEPMIDIDTINPDIYYIVLDGYARADVLEDVYNYNNRPFLDKMNSIGFNVSSQSFSNYVRTSQSLPSSINMEYVHLKQRGSSRYSTQNSHLLKFLKTKGYLISVISNGWGSSNMSVISNPDRNYDVGLNALSSFQITLIRSSFLFLLDIIKDNRYSYDRVLDAFEWLTKIPDANSPRFIFAHILSPHPPYLFGRNGEKIPRDKFIDSTINSWNNKEAYIEQLIFINEKVKLTIKEILDNSDVPPIIIIQSDHGPATELGPGNSIRDWSKPNKTMIKERAANLFMSYLPCDESNDFYNSISPVNIFRVVINSCFDSDLELLPDSLYWSWYDKPDVFNNLTDSIP